MAIRTDHLELEHQPGIMAVSFVVRIVLGLVFLISGAEKLMFGGIEAFGLAIYKYEIIPAALVNLLAMLFIWAEITVAILLLAGAAVRGAAMVTGSMLLLFIIALITALLRGLEIDCGCFAPESGIEPDPVTWGKVFEDVALLAGAIFLIYFPRSWGTVDRHLRREGALESGEVRAEG